VSRQHRGLVTVDRGGNARIYQYQALPGWEVLGTVSTAGGTGALVRNLRTRVYCQANAGCLRSLPQRKVLAALDCKAGVVCNERTLGASLGEAQEGGARQTIAN